MSKWVITAIKLLLVAGLMWFVFSGIAFEDRLVFSAPGTDDVLAEETIHIVGSWQEKPVTFTRPGDPRELSKADVDAAGRNLAISPGFLTYWRNLNPWWFALGAFCYFLTVLVAGTRWWWLLRVNGTDVSLLETWRFTWIGVFFNTIVPAGQTGGDLIKALYIMKRCPGHRVQVLVSVVVDRVLGLASLALLGAIVVLFALEDFGEVAVGIWSVIGGVGLVGVFAFSKRLRERIKLKALLEKLPHKVGHLLRLVDQAVYFYRNHKGVIIGSLLVGIANHIVSVLSVVFIGEALGVGLPWFAYFALIPVINILSALPIAPNGWGWGETLYKHLFGTYGAMYLPDVANAQQVMGTRGVALSVLYRLHLTFWSLFGGLLVLFEKDRVTKADIEKEVEREEEEDTRM